MNRLPFEDHGFSGVGEKPHQMLFIDFFEQAYWHAYTGKYSNTTYGEVVVRQEAGGLVVEFGPKGTRRPIFPWNRDAFVMPFSGADAAVVAQLGVFFTTGATGHADACLAPQLTRSTDPDYRDLLRLSAARSRHRYHYFCGNQASGWVTA